MKEEDVCVLVVDDEIGILSLIKFTLESERLRSQPQTQDIPILLITSLPDEISSQVLNRLNISQVIDKPFDALILIDLIVSTLQSN